MKNNIHPCGRFFSAVLLVAFSLIQGQVSAQTTLLSASGDGGFENGPSFAANGWTVVNGSGVTNKWFVGTVPTLFPGSNSAYVSDDAAGATHNFNNTAGSIVHFYRDVTLPAGETNLTYGYQWYAQGESTYDFVQISVGSTSIVPVAASGVAGSISPISLPLIPGTTVIGAHNLQGAVQTVTATVSSAAFGNCFAPATIRIFFTWRNDGSGGTQPPVALDNIFLESAVPAGSPISGTKTIGPGGDYPTLTAAVAVIAQNGVSSPVILELQANYTSAGETFPIVLGGQSSCSPVSSTNTVTIRPAAGATALSITGTNAGPTIDINSGNWWRIDGRPGGVGTTKELTISNTSTSGQAVRFINEGSNNIIRYTLLRGVNTSTVSGVVVFSTTTGANGNDNNLIEFCDIRDGATSPLNCVYSSATTTTLAQYNNNNTISNCNIFNYFGATSSHVGVFLAGGNSDWTITGNSFYQTSTRSTTGTVNAFQSSSSLNNNLTVTNNFIGGSEPNAGGTAMTYTGGAIIRAFLVTVGTLSASNFNNNTFQNISVTTTSTSSAQSLISLLTGRINCNNNTIGSQSTTNSIVFSLSGSAARLQAILAGTGTPELTTINNNTIGGMALIVTGAPATVPAFFPISVQGTAAGHNFTVNNNTIGSPTVANSVTSNANSSLIAVISFSGAIGQTYNNNLIANITATNTGTGTTGAGMNLQGTGTSPNFTGSFTANGNTIRNISTQSGATFVSAYGLSVSGTAEPSVGQTVTNNVIHSISNTNTSSAASIAGMLASLPSANVSTISGNTIHSLSLSTSTTTAAIRGVILNAGRPVLANNFIRLGINPDGSDIITSYNMQGILENTGTIGNIYHNSVYIGGAGVNVGASNSFAFLSASTAVGRNYRNNIFFNARSNAAGTGKHYAMSITGSAPNQAGLISDYNLLNATGTGGFIGLFNAVDQTNLADWRTATGFDFNSITGDPQFINPNGPASTVDLHISAANPTPVEGAGANAGVVNDADGQTRANFSPVDIGADAGNFVINDISGPGISYTALPSICGTGDINLSNVNITDATGIPLAGNLRPRVYYRKAAGSWFSQPGTLVSGTAQNSIWNFTMVAADMGGLVVGDIVQYYVIAQDNNGTPLIASVAGGVAATDVNNVTTHPAGAFTATVINQLSGTYTVGTGGDYPTLTAAITAYNSSCLGGAVVFSLIDATYSSSETFPITINANAFANSTNTLTIRPAAGNVATINGTSTSCIINLNGADWVIIDGSNSGGTDRSLTISNASTAAATAAVCVTSLGSNLGATNDVIKNCNIAAGSNSATTSFGIFVGGTSLTSSGTGNDNDNLTIQNNAVSKALYGIYAAAVASNANDNLLITNNLIGSSASAPDQIGQRGINLVQANNAMISQNTIFNIVGTQTNPTGIFIGAGVLNSVITRNDINSLKYTGTSGYGGKGIDVQTGSASSNLTISNNFIYDLSGDGWTALTSDAIIGIRIGTGSTVGGINVYNNSVNLFGNADRASSSTLSAALYIGSGGSNLDIRNNILKNDIVNNLTTTAKAYAINSASPASAFTFINNNDYYAAGSQGILGFLNSDILTLTNWQAATGKDGQSVAVQPVFTSNTDLHLTNTANYCLDGGGAPLAAVTVDIDGQARSATTPDIGADEFALVNMTVTATENSGIAPNDNLTCSGDPVTLTANAAGASYAWSSGGPGNPIFVNPATTTTYTCTVTDANGCTEVLAPVTITVNPLPTAFAVTGGGAYCAPGAGVPVGLDGSQSGVNYQLKRNNVNVGALVAGTGNAISFGNQTVAGTYTVSANNGGTNCSADMTGSAVVVENPTPVSFSMTGGGAYCSPGAGVPVGLGGSESGVNYQLQRGGSNVGAPVAGTGAALAFGNQTVAGIYTVVATHSNGGCTANMNGSAIVVENSTPTLTETHVEPTTCLAANGSINLTVNNGNAPFGYNWATPNGSGLVQGQEDQNGLTVGIYNVTVTDANSCSATLSQPLIGPGNCDACPIIGALSTTPAGICAGSNITLNATGLVDMGTTYGITFKYFGAPSATPYIGGTVIGTVDNSGLGNNGTTAAITTSFATGGVYYLYAILDQLPTDPSCRPSASYILTVLNIPSVNPVSNQTVCAGSNTAPVNFSGPIPGTIYNWTNNNTSIGLAASGTGNIPAFAAINNGTAPVTATITVTPSVNDPVAGTVCNGTPITFTITVNPVPTVNAVVNQTYCNGAAVPSVVFTSNVPGATFNWSRTSQAIGLVPTSGSGNVPAFTAANATNAPLTSTFTVTATYTNNGIPCTGPAIQFTITVNPTPTVSATPTSQTVCNGAATTQISLSGAVSGTVYNWTNNTPSIGLAANGTGNIPSFTAINAGGTPITATITITPTYTNNGVFCSGTPITVTITVNPTAQVNQPANVNTCGGALTAVTFTTTTPGTTYSWTNNNTAIGLAASGSGNISFTAANVVVATTGTITVTPNYTNNGVSCPGTPRTFTITVNPNPSVVPVANQPAICSGDATNAVAFTGPLSGTVFNWTNNNTNIGLAASGTGDIPSFIAQNPGTTIQTATITVTPSLTTGGVTCTGTPITFTYTVYPRPVVTLPASVVICQDQNAVLSATLGGGATGGTWSGGAGQFVPVNNPNATYIPAASEYGTTVTLTFTSNDPAGPCPAVSASTQLTINTLPIVFAGNDIKICPGSTLDMTLLNATITDNGSGVTTGNWTTSGTGTFQPNNAFPGATLYVPSQADYNAGFVILTLTSADPAGPCNAVSDAVRLGFKKSGAPVCNNNVQVSLDSTGIATIEPDMVLEGTYEYEFYDVDVIINGQSIGNQVNCTHIDKTYTVKITDICTGNICWGTIKVEDKLPPKMTCNNYNLVCVVDNFDPNYIVNTLGVQNGIPTVQENCPPATLTHVDDYTDLDCTQQFSARLRRTWTATDASGNSSSCIQTINFERRGINNVLFPADITLACDANGVNTTPQATGAPYFTAFNQNWQILPTVGACEIQSAFVDQVLPVCDGTYKILRTWTVYDWCLPTKPTAPNQNPQYFIQVIKVDDLTGPALTCPANVTVGTDAVGCCASTDLPDVVVEDACSRVNSATARIVVRDPVTNLVVATYEYNGTIEDFPGNNHWDADTLVAFGLTDCLPLGAHTTTYLVTDACGNTRTCTFRLTVDDRTPPVAACDDFTNVSLGVNGEAFVFATTFDDGSYDNCGTVSFKARRMDSNGCQSNGQFHDEVKFCCEDIGDTIMVVFRAYDIVAQTGSVSLTYEEQNANDCMVRVFVEDKIKPFCKAPAHVTVACEAFDPTLWAYGFATAEDNCCIDTITETRNLSLFDTLCNRGTITRTFRAFDCGGQTNTCTQRVVVNYNQNYYLRFPNDVIVTACNGTGNYGEPAFFGEDCELLAVSHHDEIFTVVPDACFKIERTWTVNNWCTYDPNLGCIDIPNPNPNPSTNHPSNLTGPTISPAGTPAPWTPTVVAILPGQTPTNYSTFWNANANCYRYKQIIKIIDTQKPVIENCPSSPQEVCDVTPNAGDLWNEMYWWDNGTQSHDLCEAPTDLSITATDLCSGSNINIRYQLFLDLDGDGTMETIINSTQTGLGGLGWNNVPFGNAGGGSGTPRQFDERPVPANQKYGFAIQTTTSGTNKTASVRWNTQQAQATYVVPELPYGVHKIKWLVEDGCGNEQTCEYIFEVKDCKKPTVVCINGLSVNIMPTKMITLTDADFLLHTDDNCTPANRLITAIRKAGQGTGFPLNPDNTPQKSVTFTCAELGKQNVEIWSRDLAGNADFCVTYVEVQDNMGNCTGSHATVSGALKTEAGNGLEDASVSVGNMTSSSDASGMYAVGGLPYGNDYTVTPLKDNDPLNGVSTFDLVLINKHILGLEPLNSPYKMISADANNSRSITTFDIVELRKLILGIYTELPNNTSWRFVDKGFAFPNPQNPFQTLFPETKQYAALQSSVLDADFYAMKVGDVNGNAVTSSLVSTEDRTAGTLLFDVQDRTVKAGETFTVTFKAAEKVQGYQFTLNHAGLELVDVKPGANMNLGNFGVFAADQAVTTSWDGDVQAEFALTFRAAASGELSRMLGVSGRITKAEAYNAGAERLQVGFRFNGANGQTITGLGFELYQNMPNPFVNKTQIGFHLPEATTATLTIFDETGRMLFTQKGDFAKGYNAVTVDRSVLNATGVLYYTLETAKESATRKMIQTK